MKERGILFSGLMVCAILDGRKTQTRRVVNPQPSTNGFVRLRSAQCDDCGDHYERAPKRCKCGCTLFKSVEVPISKFDTSPYGRRGDRLWVRETWCQSQHLGDIFYRATHQFNVMIPWRPSIFMPRKFSRITLEIVSVRVERVQDISGEDAQAEGWPRAQELFPGVNTNSKAQDWYRKLWDSINAKRGFGWDKNPWCWVLEFKRV